MNGLNRPDPTRSGAPDACDPVAWASAVAAFAEVLRRTGPEGVHVPADDARRLGEMLAGAEAPGSFHRGLRQGEAQARAAIEAMTVLHVRAPTDAERAAFVEAARNQPPGALVAESPDACDALGRAVIEAAHALAAAWDEAGTRDMDGMDGPMPAYAAADRLVQAVRAYDAAGRVEHEGGRDAIRQG